MSTKNDYSKRIIKILGDKKAIEMGELANNLTPHPSPGRGEGKKSNYAITRSMKGLIDSGLIENVSSGQNEYARLTKEGKRKAISLKLENENALVDAKWDGFWRIVLLDLPEARVRERESLRYLLKKAGFVCLKNSVWITPYPFEHLFINIKKDLNLTTELIILVTSKIDEETERVLADLFNKK